MKIKSRLHASDGDQSRNLSVEFFSRPYINLVISLFIVFNSFSGFSPSLAYPIVISSASCIIILFLMNAVCPLTCFTVMSNGLMQELNGCSEKQFCAFATNQYCLYNVVPPLYWHNLMFFRILLNDLKL